MLLDGNRDAVTSFEGTERGRGPSGRTKQKRNALRILFEMEMNSSTLVEVLEGKRQVGESEQGLFTVELAKEFSTEDSGKFINGLLGVVNRDREEGKLVLPIV